MGRGLRLVGLVVFVVGCSSDEDTKPVFIGHIISEPGISSPVNHDASQGVALALEEGKEHKLLGHPFAALHVNTNGDADLAREEAVRLLTVNNAVAILGTVGAEEANALLKATRGYGLPLVLSTGEEASLGHKAVRIVGAASEDRTKALASHVLDTLKPKKVAFLSLVDAPTKFPVADALQAQLSSEATIEVKSFRLDPKGDKPSALKEYQPNLVVLSVSAEAIATTLDALADLTPSVPMVYAGPDVSLTRLPSELRQYEVYFATAFYAESKMESVEKFVAQYKKRFNEVPTLDAVLSFEGTRLLLATMSKASGLLDEQIREEFAKTSKIETVTGSARVEGPQVRRKVFVLKQSGTQTSEVSLYKPPEPK